MAGPASIVREPSFPGVSDIGLAEFLETLHDGVAVTDRDRRLKYYNDRLVKMFRLSPGDLVVGQGLDQLLRMFAARRLLGATDGRTDQEMVYDRLKDWGTEESRVERRFLEDGRILDIYRTPTSNDDIVSIHVDVTEAVRNAQELERQRQYMVSLLENTTDGIALLDRDGRFVMYNNQVLELYDVDPDKAYWGMSFVEMATHFGDLVGMSERDRAREIANRYRFAFDPKVTNVQRRLADGRTLNVNKRNLPGGGCVMTYRDITEDLNRENELIGARNEAEESSRHKSEFVARMSHEMRTPLNGVLGVAALLQRSDLGSQEREMVDVITSSGKVLLRLIDDILDLSKLDAETFEMVEEDFDLSVLLDECAGMISPSAAEKGLELQIQRQGGMPPLVFGDMVRIKQILLNLMTNAVKFTESGSIELGQSYDVGPEGVTATFGVTDTGVGIADDQLDQIFNRFYQIDGTVTRKYGGAGLGLAITQKLVDAMGGTIQVSSKQGEGTSFRVRLTLPISEKVKCAS